MAGKLFSFFIDILRRRRIFIRLLIMFLLATFLPLFLFSVWSWRNSSRLMQEKIYVSYNEMLEQITSVLNQKIRKIRNDLIEISYMSEFQEMLESYSFKNDRERNLIKMNITEAMSRKYAFDNIVSGILLYTLDGHYVDAYGSNVVNYNLNQEYQNTLLKTLYEQNGRSFFCAVNRDDAYKESAFTSPDCAILAGKAVKHARSGQILGYLILQIDESQLSGIFLDAAASLESRILILNSEGTVISSSKEDRAQIGEIFPWAQTLEEMPNTASQNDPFLSVSLDDQKYEALYQKLDYLDWTIYFLTDFSYVQAQIFPSVSQLLRILLPCVLFGTVVTFLFTLSIVTPLNQVADGMERFEKGNLSVILDESGNDEVTRLASQFNNMTREINLLLETEKNSEKQKRILEIQALQAQINPHFLSNTLNTVSYIAQIRKEETIHQMLNATIELLRDSMKNDDSFHPVQEEIDSIRNYVTLQEYRLMGRFSMETDLDDQIFPCLIPRFILQPIVENAIIHGIEPLKKRGRIDLHGYFLDDKLIFEVRDNGVGMNPEEAGSLLRESANREKSRFSGMGMGNVDKRIKLLCGQEYGLSLSSEKGVFTTVRVTLPIVEESPQIHSAENLPAQETARLSQSFGENYPHS